MVETDFQIKPEKGGASVDTASWPLLLKVRTTSPNLLLQRLETLQALRHE